MKNLTVFFIYGDIIFHLACGKFVMRVMTQYICEFEKSPHGDIIFESIISFFLFTILNKKEEGVVDCARMRYKCTRRTIIKGKL